MFNRCKIALVLTLFPLCAIMRSSSVLRKVTTSNTVKDLLPFNAKFVLTVHANDHRNPFAYYANKCTTSQ